jgi:hypothetical protein
MYINILLVDSLFSNWFSPKRFLHNICALYYYFVSVLGECSRSYGQSHLAIPISVKHIVSSIYALPMLVWCIYLLCVRDVQYLEMAINSSFQRLDGGEWPPENEETDNAWNLMQKIWNYAVFFAECIKPFKGCYSGFESLVLPLKL